MPTSLKLTCLMFCLILPAGCDQSFNTSDSLDPDEAMDEFDAELEQRIAEGWYDFEEPIGDESYAEAQLTPKQPVAGQPARLVFIAGSSYGVPTGVKVWARAGDPGNPVDWQNPSDTPAWTEMKAVKAQVMDYDSRAFRDVPLDYRSAEEEQGQIVFEAELTFPTGDSPVEFKIDPGYEGSQIMAFEGWRVTAKEE